ncbi:hypothetical protein GCM10011409_25190 [Lentibacillus populi]|uniref:Uncharacterized protein n=1 Tax=Lentibacillus populi TaxID=1827502 RepID=A0A9W5X5Y9_9BACI|nr:hypothetical protein [Lentibacillus populi]GGB46599.1 hypothetical protein GCM10011409_25190 [Lentibacillus populi]
MGLFINTGVHPDVFMNQGTIKEPNQGYFKIDYFAELVKSQKQINNSLADSLQKLQILYQQQKNTQVREWQEIGNQLNSLRESNLQHEKFERNAMEWLTMLDENNKKLYGMLEEEGLLKQEIADKINSVSQSNQEIKDQIGNYESLNKQLVTKMDELFDLQKVMADNITDQNENQHKTLNHLENQEALLEKTLRQVTNIRSALFERANFLAEKIENSYKLTSSFVYNLVTGTDQPLTFRMNQKKEEKSEKP